MIRRLTLGVVATALVATFPVRAEEPAPVSAPPAQSGSAETGALPGSQVSPESPAVPVDPIAETLRGRLASLDPGTTDEERAERAALIALYEARNHAPLWLSQPAGISGKGLALIAEFKRAGEWGLDASDFALPAVEPRAGVAPAPGEIADAELQLSLAILKYGRYARGGRIIHPAAQLSSYLDRRPQLLKPKAILEGIAGAENPDAYLRGLHPQHPQFERLRQKYVGLLARRASTKSRHGIDGAEANRLLANMEQWRWMPADMGELYVWNNIPEYTQRVVKNGEVLATERIVAGEIGKQTPIFSRPMRRITFRPIWKVPESIKVRELWPSLLRGGGLMREWDLEIRTKDGGQLVDWRRLDWTKTDIREYDVIQPNGPKSVMGKVKFSFPNQHTVFMHDTLPRDKYMFNAAQRTYSHGCMRVRNPMRLAEILLREDQDWDAARVAEAFNTGPLNNEVALEHRIPVHTTYFTAMVDDHGRLQTFPDVYGHEKRIVQALEGKWDQIARGRDHLAPVELDLASAAHRGTGGDANSETPARQSRVKGKGNGGVFESLFGTF